VTVALLDTCHTLGRAELLRIIAETLPAFEQLGGKQVIAEIRRAVLDTASWYP
jgi:fructose-specific component phosphotransferase system IIB-like protein